MDILSPEVVVVRAGITTPKQLQDGVSEHTKVPGLLGFSVQAEIGCTIVELANGGHFLNRQISVTTVGELVLAGLSIGYQVRVVKSPGQGYHCTVTTPLPLPDNLAQMLSQVFQQMPHPRLSRNGRDYSEG